MTLPSGVEYEFAVVGGGLVGSAIAWGLARLGQRVVVLDQGDIAYRASRGNFALVWVQSKGLGMPEYAGWTKRSSDGWAGFASELKDTTGIATDRAHNCNIRGTPLSSLGSKVVVVTDGDKASSSRGARRRG